jgi:hypothetical protein
MVEVWVGFLHGELGHGRRESHRNRKIPPPLYSLFFPIGNGVGSGALADDK